MNNRRDLLKALALLPLAACTRTVENGAFQDPRQSGPSPTGWQPDGKELYLQKVKIKKVKAIVTALSGLDQALWY